MKPKLKKVMLLFSTVCILHALIIGCSSSLESIDTAEQDHAEDLLSEKSNNLSPENNDKDMKKTQENMTGKWQVFEPEVAAAFDADFMGKVWKITDDSFFIAEKKVRILDDGTLTSSSPSSNAYIPDSQLIHVVFDDNTYFYVRTIYNNGERYEDEEAGFQDLKPHMSVDMKGRFENDVFHASEIRLSKIS